MEALKWVVVVIFSLGGFGALGMGILAGGVKGGLPETSLPPLALRAMPPMPDAVARVPAAPAAPEKPPEEPAKAPEPVAKAPEAPAKTPESVAKAPEPAKSPEPVAKAPEPAKKPEPVAKASEPDARAPSPAAAPVEEGMLNLRASDTADVYVDGKSVGNSPVLGFKVKAGTHRVRFDCYDAAGNAIAGPVKTVTVKADEEQDVEFTCPEVE
jgi:serine/threonine-protein kinase